MESQKMYVRLCEKSNFSFKSINENFDYKSLSCFIARNLVWQECSFAPVQKNQNPAGGFDSPGPLNDLAGAIRCTDTH